MNVPKLRFKEFNDEYKYRNLSDISTLIKDGTHGTHENYENGIPLLSAKDINNNKINIPEDCRKISVDDYNKIYKNYLLKKDDILLTIVGSIGRTALYKNEKVAFQRSVATIRIDDNNNSNYIRQYIESPIIINQLNNMTNSSAQGGVYLSSLSKLNFDIPRKEEQLKVAKFLSLLDKKIELQFKKIEDLKLFKKGLHDKLFNEVTGNDYLLSDIAVFENGKGHENIIDENGKYILINSKFISTEGNVTKKCSEQLTPLFKNDITMVMSDLPNGKALAKCYYIDENNKYSLNQRICKIKVKDDSIINSKYLFYLLNRNSYYLRFDDGVNQTNLKKDDILSLNLVLPSIKEQERDSKTLTIIDNFIEKENNKLSKLFLLKKGLMQSMFV